MLYINCCLFKEIPTASKVNPLPPPLSATLGDYEEEDHKPGYTADFEDFHLIPKDSRVSPPPTISFLAILKSFAFYSRF